MSRALQEMSRYNLVMCITPEEVHYRFYRITKQGEQVVKEVKKVEGHSAREQSGAQFDEGAAELRQGGAEQVRLGDVEQCLATLCRQAFEACCQVSGVGSLDDGGSRGIETSCFQWRVGDRDEGDSRSPAPQGGHLI